MIRIKFVALLLLSSVAIFARGPVSLDNYAITDLRQLEEAASTEASDRFYSASAFVGEGQETMTLMAEDLNGAMLRVIAIDESGHNRNFLVPLSGTSETQVNLGGLGDKKNLFFLANDPFTAVLGGGANTTIVEVDARYFDRDAIRAKTPGTICSVESTFDTLTCISPSTCGSLVINSEGTVYSCNTYIPGNPDPIFSYQIEWGCHTGSGNIGGVVITESSCGCQGYAIWTIYFGHAIDVKSKCPGDAYYSRYSVQ